MQTMGASANIFPTISTQTNNNGREVRKPTDLDQEPRERKRVLPQYHPSPVPDQFAHAAPEDAEHEGPGLVFDAEGEVDEHGEEEEGDEDDVGGQFGAVLVDADGGGAVGWAGG